MKKILILSALSVALLACGGNNRRNTTANRNTTQNATAVQSTTATPNAGTDRVQSATPPDSHTSNMALDWAGTYSGTIPCADCAGIEVIVTLGYDNNYTKKMTYLGKKNKNVFTTEGAIEWAEDGNKITLKGETAPESYQVGENRLYMLDSSGNRITGDMADLYILTKTM